MGPTRRFYKPGFHIQVSGLLPFWSAGSHWLTYGVELARFGKTGAYSVREERLLYFHREKPQEEIEPSLFLNEKR